jgi:hypothetical protein
MLERGLSGDFRNLLERQQVDHHGHGIVQAAAFHVGFGERGRVYHRGLVKHCPLDAENLQRDRYPVKRVTAEIALPEDGKVLRLTLFSSPITFGLTR